MSLYKQFWLFIILLVSTAFLGSVIFSCISAKNYLEEHLTQKNNDNALTLALSLSSGSQDQVSMELSVNAQFDLGHYHFISLVDTEGEIIATRYDDEQYSEAPAWLMKLFPIEIKPGVANVSSGWQQVGILTLSSHERFAYKQLWNNVKQLIYYFVLVSLAFSVLGSVAIRWLSQSLNQAVAQATAIGDKRFITTSEPRIPELRNLIRSLNKLSEHVKQMLENESSKLETLRQQTQYDEVTSLYNRAPLLGQLNSLLQKQNEASRGALLMLRIVDLFDLNQRAGRQTIDSLLVQFGEQILKVCRQHSSQASAGRLNGSDFLLIIPTADQVAEKMVKDLFELLMGVCRERNLNDITLLTSSTVYRSEHNTSELLSSLDQGLQDAVNNQTNWFFVDTQTALSENDRQTQWPQILNQGFSEQGFQLNLIPVVTAQGDLLHWEAPLLLQQKGMPSLDAAQFMPHISRLGMSFQLDRTAVQMAIDTLKNKPSNLAIRLSASTLTKPTYMKEIAALIKQSAHLSHHLNIEFAEYNVFPNIDALNTFCQLLRSLDCKVGIAHAGQEIKQLGKVHNLGLHYVKIDSFFIRDIHTTPAHQAYLRGLCTLLHSIGLKAIAEGVNCADEWESLKLLGINGGSGDFLSADGLS
ncbi:EAL domain, c-di-GMP-specific phosphodiesterase class I (or its enzymatically inactive variant) [Alteromonadaceae bacterium Bs31]|nr:EAL domain, c-di-GMP-specific phosphodiesterase class I (or its enzymatically inactive variant) [Alteromonadaceae bacterium Bs31]